MRMNRVDDFQQAQERAGTPRSMASRLTRLASAIALTAVLSGCVGATLDDLGGGPPPLPKKLVSEMSKKKMSPSSPVLIRIFKQESELEVWKKDKTGQYALLKTYPMCRWSGKLGPKTRSGDRQAPEGFYHVSAGMLNPNSQFYLSFNLGYPNRLESALGYTGDALMVHGACSSSGCYAMTDQGVSEIYAVAYNALKGGQQHFQVQAYPFRMTAANMAAHSTDPNYGFWKNLKQGYDIFEVTKRQPKVNSCGRRYVFDAEFAGGDPKDPLAECPPVMNSPDPLVAARFSTEETRIAAAIAQGTAATAYGYVDGGMHQSFRTLLEKTGPEKLAERTSRRKYPVSRPEAALADPFN